MPVYEYEHVSGVCENGSVFEIRQAISEPALKTCPHCGQPVKRLISLVGVSVPKTNSELRDMGFTKLVRRDDGIYENVTPRKGDSRYMERGKPGTIPNIANTITD
ncbi:MAG: zinc ribbon domain-containing protein [Deltaproteobacteria bacterium]|nr:MAG: zinc ribbon domain-containing protein [Deltaproteobacteria bacterium]